MVYYGCYILPDAAPRHPFRKGIPMDIIQTLAHELDRNPQHVENVVRLLDEGKLMGKCLNDVHRYSFPKRMPRRGVR